MHTFSSYNFTRKKTLTIALTGNLHIWSVEHVFFCCLLVQLVENIKKRTAMCLTRMTNTLYYQIIIYSYSSSKIILVWAAKLQFSQSHGCNYGTPNTWLKLGDHVQQICNRESCFSYLLFIAAAILHRFYQKLNIFFQHIHRNIDIDDIYRYIIS